MLTKSRMKYSPYSPVLYVPIYKIMNTTLKNIRFLLGISKVLFLKSVSISLEYLTK